MPSFSSTDVYGVDSPKTAERNESFSCIKLTEDIVISYKELSNIKKESPFTVHYNNIITKLESLMTNYNKLSHLPSNIFYNPHLFKLVIDQLHILPLWTCIIFSVWQANQKSYEPLCRVSNNPVENWFHQLKHSLMGKLKSSPSAVVSCFAENIMAKYILHYDKDSKNDTNEHENGNESSNDDAQEIWKDKHEKKNNRRRKGFYFSNTNWFINHYDIPQIDMVRSKEFIEVFETGKSSSEFYI